MKLIRRTHEYAAWADNGFFIRWYFLDLVCVQLGLHHGSRRWTVSRRIRTDHGPQYKLLYFGKRREDA